MSLDLYYRLYIEVEVYVMGWLCLAQLVRSGWYGQIRSVWADLGRLGQITCKAGSASFTCIVLLELLSSSPA